MIATTVTVPTWVIVLPVAVVIVGAWGYLTWRIQSAAVRRLDAARDRKLASLRDVGAASPNQETQ